MDAVVNIGKSIVYIEQLLRSNVSPQDAEDISNLSQHMYGEKVQVLWAELVQTVGSKYVYVARKNSDGDRHPIVGMATVSVSYLAMGGSEAFVEEVVVFPDFQHQGIGKKLMQQVIDTAKLHGVEEVWLTSAEHRRKAHNLYKSLGFKEKKTTVFVLPCIKQPPN